MAGCNKVLKTPTMLLLALLLPCRCHGRKSLAQYDQVFAEIGTPPALSIPTLLNAINQTNTNTMNFLLWDTDGHQYLDLVRFLDATKDMRVGVDNGPLEVWITLIPKTETVPAHLVPMPPQPNCATCPQQQTTNPYGDPIHGIFCCGETVQGESCPAGAAVCCLLPGSVNGCQNVARCGTNLRNESVCGAATQCSIPRDSPLTTFNETSLVNQSMGYMGCNDYVGWGRILSLLAAEYPTVKAMNMDDYAVSIMTDFGESHSKAVADALHGKHDEGGAFVKFIPTFYYDTNNGEAGGSTRFILEHYPWLINVTDGVLFYFQHRKGGQDVCRTSNLCAGNPCQGYWCCLWDTCAEASLPAGLPDEVGDFARVLPPGKELHVGLYFEGYGSGPTKATPSVRYANDALQAIIVDNLNLTRTIDGAMIYVTTVPGVAGCPNPADEGCVVKELFGAASKLPPRTLVGVHYFAGWYPGPYSHWLYFSNRTSWTPNYPGRVPLTGNYTTNLSTVNADLIAADSHGVDFFEVLWMDPVCVGGCAVGKWVRDPNLIPCTDTALAWMLNTSQWDRLNGTLRFLISYSTDFDAVSVPAAVGMFVGQKGLERWDSYVSTWVDAMAHSKYLKVDGRPVFKILGPSNFLDASCEKNSSHAQFLIDRFRDFAVKAGVGNPIIGGGWVSNDLPMPSPTYQGVKYDYHGAYNGAARNPALGPCEHNYVYPFAQLDNWVNGGFWGNHSSDSVPFVPNVVSGFDPRPAEEVGACSFAQPTVEEWRATLSRARAMVENTTNRLGFPSVASPTGVVPAITMYAWNEFAEGGMICPTRGEGFDKLNIVKETFA